MERYALTWISMCNGRWSLTRFGRLFVFAVVPRCGDIKVRSIIEYLKVCEFNLVPM